MLKHTWTALAMGLTLGTGVASAGESVFPRSVNEVTPYQAPTITSHASDPPHAAGATRSVFPSAAVEFSSSGTASNATRAPRVLGWGSRRSTAQPWPASPNESESYH